MRLAMEHSAEENMYAPAYPRAMILVPNKELVDQVPRKHTLHTPARITTARLLHVQ